jgi:glycosyltransferase involved in cell wall biosynthesis
MSALSQTIKDFEVVVIDDGSTDLTSERLDRIKDSRLKIVHCTRMGRSRALNFGLEKCSSTYVAILDADDIALPCRLQLQTEFLNSNPDIALVGSRFCTVIDEDGDYKGRERVLPTAFEEIYRRLKEGKNAMFHSSIMFRKDTVSELGGYDEGLPCCEDLDLYVRVATSFKIANIEERLSLKRRHLTQFFGNGGFHSSPEGQQARAIVGRRMAGLPRTQFG